MLFQYIYIYASVHEAIIDSANGLSLVRRQAIICTNAGVLLTESLGINFKDVLQQFSFKKTNWKYRLPNGGHFLSFLMC